MAFPHATASDVSITCVPSHPPSISHPDDHGDANGPRPSVEGAAEKMEHEIEGYGGDNPHEPPPKICSSEPGAVSETDQNMVTWDGPDDPENPQNWSNGYKWCIAAVGIIMTFNVSFDSSAPVATILALELEFGVSAEVTYFTTSCFLFGYVVGPLIWGPGSELIGRRPIFLFTTVLYTLFHLGQALATNIQALLITRFFAGFFAAAPLNNIGGVFADIFSAEARGIAASLFAAGVFLGPVLGPIVSGYVIGGYISWRWVYWIMMIFAGSCTVAIIFLLPETYAPVILLKKAKRLRRAFPVTNAGVYAEHEKQDWSISGVVKRTVFKPFQMLAMEPILMLVTIYISIVYGLLYALFEAIPIIFIVRRGFTISQNGLIFIGVGLGTTLGAVINAGMSTHYPGLIKKWKGFPPPEQRLRGAMVGAPSLVVAIFWLGWAGEYSVIPWYVPALSTIPLGMGISLIFMSFLSYLLDTYLMSSASAFAANTTMRSAVAAAFPLFTVQMFTKLHVNGATSLLGLFAALLAPCPFLFYKYGPRIRERSRFAPCIDLQIAKELEQESIAEGGKVVEV